MLYAITLRQFIDFPLLDVGLIACSIFYLLLLVVIPRAWLLILPIFSVSVDLTTWSGRFLFNELDLIFVTTITYQLLSRQFPQKYARFGTLLAASYFLLYVGQSATTFFFALSEVTAPSFSNPYYQDGYAYKLAKGVIWGALLSLMYVKQLQDDKDLTILCSTVGASLAGFALFFVILWERGTLGAIFQGGPWWAIASSLLDFTSSYRTTGIFSDMHTGGEVVDGIILLLLPFSLYGLTHCNQIWVRIIALTGFTCLAYVTLVGFTRATYMAVTIAGVLYFTFGVKHQTHLRPLKAIKIYTGYLAVIVLSAILSRYIGSAYGIVAYTIIICTAAAAAFFLGHTDGAYAKKIALSAGLGIVGVVAYFSVNAHLANRWITASNTGVVFTLISVILLFAVAMLVFYSTKPESNSPRLIPPLMLVAISAAVSFASGGYKINERMQDVGRDMTTRFVHWQNVIASGESSLKSIMFGNGVGSFPDNYLFAFPATLEEVGSFAINKNDDGSNSLVLGGGRDLAFGQRVPIEANTNYTIKVSYKADADSGLAMFLCERNLIFASNFMSNCAAKSQKLPATGENEGTIEFNLNSKTVGKKSSSSRWPTLLYIKNSHIGKPIEISRLELVESLDANERVKWQLLQNTDFNQGMDRWFFYNDYAHLPWHIKNTVIQAYYDTGLIGLALLLALLLYAATIAIKYRHAEPIMVALVLGPISLVIFGMFGTPLDSARVGWLFYLMLFSAVIMCTDSTIKGTNRV